MKTIRLTTLACLATVMVAGMAYAEEAGKVRLTDFGTDNGDTFVAPVNVDPTTDDVVIRGASDLRRRNAQTSRALRALFTNNDSDTDSVVQQTGLFTKLKSQPINCDACDGCAPILSPDECAVLDTCGPPACAAPVCAAPEFCCPPAPACAAPVCAAPDVCCPPACAAPVCAAPPCAAPDVCCPPGCEAPCDACCPNTCDGCDTAGIYRISDSCFHCGGKGCSVCRTRKMKQSVKQGWSNLFSSNQGNCRHGNYRSGYGSGTCQHGHRGGNCRLCSSKACVNNNGFADFLGVQAAAHRARNRQASANLNQYLGCKMGYFIPSGNGGTGSPLVGHYNVVYPVDAGYSDDRDSQVYSAQGYGGAVSVPLAPTVRQTYNYGWGIPSSRLTPVSNTPAY